MKAHLFTIAAVLAAAAPAARADNALSPEQVPVKARDLAEQGRRHHEAGNYSAAVAAFKEAYVLAPSPSLLFNIAQSYRLAGNCDEASWMYRRFLDTNPRGDQRALAEQHLAAVEKCGTGGLRISEPPPKVEVPLDPTATGAQLGASLAGGPATLTLRDADQRGSKLKRAGLYTMIGGGVVLAGAAYFAYDSANAASSVETTYADGGKWSDVRDEDARGKRSAAIATTLGLGGGLAVISGAVLYGLGHHYERARYVAVNPTKHGAQVSLSWGF